MIKQAFLENKRLILTAAGVTIGLQGAAIVAFDIIGLGSGRDLFGALMNWAAIVLFVILPFVAAWRSERRNPPSSSYRGPSALVIGLVVNGVVGMVSLTLGLASIAMRIQEAGWTQEQFVVLAGTVVGFLAGMPLGAALGWTAGKLARAV